MTFTLKNICRLCLKTPEEVTPMVDYFHKTVEDAFMCASVQDTEPSTLPQTICVTCHQTMQIVFDFKHLVTLSQHILQRFVLGEFDTRENFEQTVKHEITERNAFPPFSVSNIPHLDIKIESFESENQTLLVEIDQAQTEKKNRTMGVNFKRVRRKKKDKLEEIDNRDGTDVWDDLPRDTIENEEISDVKPPRHKKTCGLCQERVRNYNAHMSRVHQLYTCQICKETFASSRLKQRHISKTHVERMICHICGMEYKGNYHFINHHGEMDPNQPKSQIKRENEIPGIYPCEICDKKYKLKSSRDKHKRDQHEGMLKMLSCDICDKKLTAKNLKRHVASVHHKIKLATCEICSMPLKDSHVLKLHMRRHTDERPYQCPHCSESFRVAHVLRNHVMRHTGERPYGCKFCDRRFIQQYALQTHMKTHTSDVLTTKAAIFNMNVDVR